MKRGISLFAGVLLTFALLFSCSDNDSLSEFEICQEECGGACAIPLGDQLCGDDGLLYCSKCELECAGVEDMEGMMVGCDPEEGDTCSREGALATNATEGGGMCTCTEGKWLCTTDFEELWGDCPKTCDETCEVNKDMPCGADGALYCNLCVMECRGVKEADDPAVCTTGQSECIDTPKLVWDSDFCNGCSCYPAVSGPHFSCTGMACE